jgi:hypothetical protein
MIAHCSYARRNVSSIVDGTIYLYEPLDMHAWKITITSSTITTQQLYHTS